MSSETFSHALLPLEDNEVMIYDPLKIRTLREAKGWTKTKLAKVAGLSVPSVWSLEKGETKMPKHETMLRIASALGVPVSAISAATVSSQTMKGQEAEILAIFETLHQSNRSALVAAAAALLKSQSKK